MLKEGKIKLCFVGNPNVGKSTLINRLLKSNELKTSKHPGTTKSTIEKKLIRLMVNHESCHISRWWWN